MKSHNQRAWEVLDGIGILSINELASKIEKEINRAVRASHMRHTRRNFCVILSKAKITQDGWVKVR